MNSSEQTAVDFDFQLKTFDTATGTSAKIVSGEVKFDLVSDYI